MLVLVLVLVPVLVPYENKRIKETLYIPSAKGRASLLLTYRKEGGGVGRALGAGGERGAPLLSDKSNNDTIILLSSSLSRSV